MTGAGSHATELLRFAGARLPILDPALERFGLLHPVVRFLDDLGARRLVNRRALLQVRIERFLQLRGRLRQHLRRLGDLSVTDPAHGRILRQRELRSISATEGLQIGCEAIPFAFALGAGRMLAKEVVDGCPLLEERGDFRARCVVRFQTLLEPIDVLLEVVEEVLDVDFPVRSRGGPCS